MSECKICNGRRIIWDTQQPGPPSSRDCECQWRPNLIAKWEMVTRKGLGIAPVYELDDSLQGVADFLISRNPQDFENNRYLLYSEDIITADKVASYVVRGHIEHVEITTSFNIINFTALNQILTIANSRVGKPEDKEQAEELVNRLLERSNILVIGGFEIPTRSVSEHLKLFMLERGAVNAMTILTSKYDKDALLSEESYKQTIAPYKEIPV